MRSKLAAVAVTVLFAGVVWATSPTPPASQRVPTAILGEGAPPTGTDLRYLPDDPATVGYLAEPAGAGPHGAVILIHEWNGLVGRVRQVADAFAAEGYVALAADLYAGRTGSSREENIALMRETRADPDLSLIHI